MIERPAARMHALLERGSIGERIVRRSPAGAPIGNLLRLAALDAMGTKHVLEDLRICAGRAPGVAAPTVRPPKPDILCAIDTFPNICFGKIEICVMIAPIEAIEIGILPTVASWPLGQAWPRAFAKFGDGLRRESREGLI
jgi:hypothetical protein